MKKHDRYGSHTTVGITPQSSKTTRGSRSSMDQSEPNSIVQSTSGERERTITIDEVSRLLELGKLLGSTLTESELNNLRSMKSEQENTDPSIPP